MVTWDELRSMQRNELLKNLKKWNIPHNVLNRCRFFCTSVVDFRLIIVDYILGKNTKNDLMLFFNLKIKPIVGNRKIFATYTDILQTTRFAIEKFSELQHMDINNSNFCKNLKNLLNWISYNKKIH